MNSFVTSGFRWGQRVEIRLSKNTASLLYLWHSVDTIGPEQFVNFLIELN